MVKKVNPLQPLINDVKDLTKKGAKFGKPVMEPTPKVKRESDNSVTISYLNNGCGNNEMKLNIHAYKTANSMKGSIRLSIIDHSNKTLGSVILDPNCGDLMPLFEQINDLL